MKAFALWTGLALVAVVLLMAVADLPTFGAADSPAMTHVVPRYLAKGLEESATENIVTSIVLNYRGYDTMGEVTVIFTALCGVLAAMGREDRRTSFSLLDRSGVGVSVVVYTVVRLLVPFILLFAAYIIAFGTSSPGGGFQGGTVIGASFIVFTVVFGYSYSLGRLPWERRVLVESIAPISFIAVGLTGIALGADYLTFMPAAVPPAYRALVAKILLDTLEVGIGLGGAAVLTSVFFALQREEPTAGEESP